MKDHYTIPGKLYAVTSGSGCSVTMEDGTLVKECESPQDYFIAPAGKVICSDAAAIITETFNLAPIAFGGGGKPGWYDVLRSELAALLGEDNFSLTYAWVDDKFTLTVAVPFEITDEQMAQVRVLLGSIPPKNLVTEIDEIPFDFTRLDYLESKGTQYMLFDLKLAECGIDVQITPTRPEMINNFPFSWQTNYSGENGTSYRGFRWIPSNSYVSWWDAGILNAGINTFGVKTEVSANFKNNKKIKLTANGKTYEQALGEVTYCPFEKACWGKLLAWDKNGNLIIESSAAMKMHHIAMSEGSTLKYDLLPALDSTGTPCLFDSVTRNPVYNSGSGAYIAGVENLDQLNNLLRKLPDRSGQGGGELHLRLSDALYESAVASGIIEETATAKNWQIAYDPTTITEAA